MNPTEMFCKWLVTAGLYSKTTFSIDDALALAESMPRAICLDCYCPECKKVSTFNFGSSSKLPAIVPNSLNDVFRPTTSAQQVQGFLPDVLRHMTFLCARNNKHKMLIYVASEVSEGGGEEAFHLEKIGQKPSQFDLASAELARYANVLDDGDFRELKSATICHAAGFHVAAFTYLRRVFERRIDKARELASVQGELKESEYRAAFYMEDRIELLRQHLPPFLVEQKKIYNILSAGIHELTEAECAEGYDVAHLGITLILDEEIEGKQRAEKIKAASVSLQKLQKKYRE